VDLVVVVVVESLELPSLVDHQQQYQHHLHGQDQPRRVKRVVLALMILSQLLVEAVVVLVVLALLVRQVHQDTVVMVVTDFQMLLHMDRQMQ
tara:strand:+ start:282 stop:557 length:276 start_codon:yes stop_codon:yes gene_type:complete